MHYLDMYAICLKGQILNTKIQVKYPLHLDVFMLELQYSDLKAQKFVLWTWRFDHNTSCKCHLDIP